MVAQVKVNISFLMSQRLESPWRGDPVRGAGVRRFRARVGPKGRQGQEGQVPLVPDSQEVFKLVAEMETKQDTTSGGDL